MNERRVKRLESQIKARAAEVVGRLADPRRGLITITRVQLDREIEHCKVYWSVLGGPEERERNEQMLQHARRYVQREIAAVLHTRSAPRVHFVHDESIEGALRVDAMIKQLREQRLSRDSEAGEEDSDSP